MATFYIPGLDKLLGRMRAAVMAEMPGTDAFIWPNNVTPITKVFGGALYEAFLRLDYVRRQAFVLTAEKEWLDQHGAQYNMPRKPPAPASGTILVTASGALLVPNGTKFTRSDGFVYAASADVSISGAGTLQVPAIAATPGTAGLAQPNSPLTMGAGPTGAGVTGALAQVDGVGFAGGLDTEPDGEPFSSDMNTYRGRILFRLRNPPQGGAPSDYVIWAGSVPGVTRVYVERRYAGPGTVRVFPLFDDLFAASGGIPDAANLAAVQEVLELNAPAGASVVAAAALPQLVNVTIFGLQPNTAAVQAAVEQELRDTFRRLGAVSGGDYVVGSMPYLATPQTFSASWIWQAVANASGELRHVLRAPSADITINKASLPVLGKISFAAV